MEPVVEREDPEALPPPLDRVLQRQLDGTLDRLGAAVREHAAAQPAAGEAGQARNQAEQLGRVLVSRPLGQLARLVPERLDHPRMAVADGGDPGPALEVEIVAPRLVPHRGPMALDDDRIGEADLDQVAPRIIGTGIRHNAPPSGSDPLTPPP